MKYIYYILSIIILLFCFEILDNKESSKILTVNLEDNIISLKNPSIITKDSHSTFKATLTNNSNTPKYINYIEIIVKDSSNTKICSFKISIEKSIAISDNLLLSKVLSYDLSDAVSFDYIIN